MWNADDEGVVQQTQNFCFQTRGGLVSDYTGVQAAKDQWALFLFEYFVSFPNHTITVPIENIKEIHSESDARYYRHQYQLSQEYEDRWLTIIYTLDGAWKTLHLIASTKDVFKLWDKTLRELHAIRQGLMVGRGISSCANHYGRNSTGKDQRAEKSKGLLSMRSKNFAEG